MAHRLVGTQVAGDLSFQVDAVESLALAHGGVVGVETRLAGVQSAGLRDDRVDGVVLASDGADVELLDFGNRQRSLSPQLIQS